MVLTKRESERSGEVEVDIAAWLERLGLEQYEQAFRENDVDAEVLPELTAEDLIGLGVTSIGHRRKLLAAIVALRKEAVPTREKTGPVTAPASNEFSDDPASSSAERRQLTVMFCDLVGSTELSARLDPEDLREVISAYHRAVSEIVAGFDGFVAKYMGDGVLVYFGYPRAHEDDAERAVRAALGVIDAVGRLDVKSVKLQARVGIATGLVVVGDLIGEGSAQEQSVVGALRVDLDFRNGPDALVLRFRLRPPLPKVILGYQLTSSQLLRSLIGLVVLSSEIGGSKSLVAGGSHGLKGCIFVGSDHRVYRYPPHVHWRAYRIVLF
jgi:hypothetical protein